MADSPLEALAALVGVPRRVGERGGSGARTADRDSHAEERIAD